MAKLDSIKPVVTKELNKNKTWVIDDEIVVDINIANATKMKSFEFVLNYPDWFELDLQTDPIEIGDFLPPPYQELVIVKGTGEGNFPEICPTQVWIKVVMDCDKPPISGDGTLATITFKVKNPFDPGEPEYCYDEELHKWIPETVIDPICMKEDDILLDGINLEYIDFLEWEGNATLWDPDQDQWAVILVDPFGPTFDHGEWEKYFGVDTVDVEFAPIPGDVNLDGHVGLLDMIAGVEFYGLVTWDYSTFYYLGVPYAVADLAAALGMTVAEFIAGFESADIADDPGVPHTVDLFDLVQLAKNWCKTEPDYDC